MYTYNDLLADLNRIQRMGARIGHIGLASLSFADAKLAILTDCRLGAAVSGRMIPYAHIGSTEGAQIIVQGAIHAREHITAKLIVEQIYYILQCGGETLKKGGMYFIPMTNPNGVTLAQFGLESVYGCARRNFLLRVNGEAGCDFSLWKANLNAVDLNVNFPAEWGTGICNVRCPSPTNYIGASPASEPETRALMRFFKKVHPWRIVSFHQPLHGVDIADKNVTFSRRLARALRLPAEKVTCGGVCGGTMTQWYNSHFKGTAITVEYGASPSKHLMQVQAPRELLHFFGAHR